MFKDLKQPYIEDIVKEYTHVLSKKYSKYFIQGAEKEDVIQEGLLGLVKALKDYDKNKAPSFDHFANVCIKRQIIDAVRKANKKNSKPLNEYLSLAQKEVYSIALKGKTYQSPEEDIIFKEDFHLIKEILKKHLSKKEEDIFTLHLSGLDNKTISSILDINYKSVDNALQRAKKKVENIYSKINKDIDEKY